MTMTNITDRRYSLSVCCFFARIYRGDRKKKKNGAAASHVSNAATPFHRKITFNFQF